MSEHIGPYKLLQETGDGGDAQTPLPPSKTWRTFQRP